ncbi:MAG: hypothetical protein ACRC1Z_15440 [Waterburya sp.]
MRLYFHTQDYGQSTFKTSTMLEDELNEKAIRQRVRNLDEHLFDECWAELLIDINHQGVKGDRYESSRDYVYRYSHH